MLTNTDTDAQIGMLTDTDNQIRMLILIHRSWKHRHRGSDTDTHRQGCPDIPTWMLRHVCSQTQMLTDTDTHRHKCPAHTRMLRHGCLDTDPDTQMLTYRCS